MDRLAALKKPGNPPHGTGQNLLALVVDSAPREQLCAWLRVPLEHAAAEGNGDLVVLLLLLAAEGDAYVRRHCHAILDRSPYIAAAQGGNGAVVSAALLASASVPTGEERISVFLGGGGGGGGDDGNVTAVAGGGGAGEVSETRSGSGSGIDSGSRSGSSSGSGSDSGGRSSSDSRSGNSGGSDNTIRGSSSSSSDGQSPLHFAASGGHVSAIKALVRAGVDIDVLDEEGCSALHLAVFRGFDKVVEELVSAGANVDTTDSEGETPLHTACGRGSLEMVRAFLRDSRGQALSAAKGNRGVHLEMSPLHRAALGGHCEVMRELVEHGSDLDSLADNARTPLHAAAMSGSADAVRFLLERNPSSLEAKDQEGRTALHLASGHRLGSDGTLTALLTAGADMESKTALGETPLLKACKALRVSAVQILLRWGADEEAIDADGRNPAAMVSHLLRSQRPGVFRDMLQTILRVLKGAPADRVWFRRGWLLMVRSAYSRRQGFDRTEGGGGDDDGRSPCCRQGFRHKEGGDGDDGGRFPYRREVFHHKDGGGRSSSHRQGFQSTEGVGGGSGRSLSRRESCQATAGGFDGCGGCGRSSFRREGLHRTKGGNDCATAGTSKWPRCPPRKLVGGMVDGVDNDNAGTNKKVEREGAAALVNPRANRTARYNEQNENAWCRARTHRTVLEPGRALERACGGGVRLGDGEFHSMVVRAIGVEEDGVFRSIVAFL